MKKCDLGIAMLNIMTFKWIGTFFPEIFFLFFLRKKDEKFECQINGNIRVKNTKGKISKA